MISKHHYVTQKPHGDYPAGTQCQAWRNGDGLLILEFQGGVLVECPGHYLKGIESPSVVLPKEDAVLYLAV